MTISNKNVFSVANFSSLFELGSELEKKSAELGKEFVVHFSDLDPEDAIQVFDFLLLVEPKFGAMIYPVKKEKQSSMGVLYKKRSSKKFLSDVAMLAFEKWPR